MTRGERAIVKEERRLEKERKRRIELANKMLIPVNGKTLKSLKLISFDPSGVFRLEGDKWLKVFEIKGADERLVDAAINLSGRIRITYSFSENGRGTCHLSLFEEGEIYEDIRRKMAEDISLLQSVFLLNELSIDEVMNHIAKNFYQDIRFSYASFVRGKRDWKKDCFFESREDIAGFQVGRLYGESFSVLAYPDDLKEGLLRDIRSLGCPMYLTIDINDLSPEDKQSFRLELEKKYNRRLPVNVNEDYINLSLSIVILCDSQDARQIVSDTLISIFLKYGILFAPSYHNQKKVSESALSLALIDETLMRNIKNTTAKKLLRGVKDDTAKVKI